MKFLASIGAASLGLFGAIGRVVIFAVQTLGHMIRPPFYLRELALSLLNIGWLSLRVVGLTAFFTGGALALQIYHCCCFGGAPPGLARLHANRSFMSF